MGKGRGKGKIGALDVIGFGDAGETMSEAFHGAFCGVCLFIGSIVLLGWNEKRAVYRAKTIDKARDEFTQLSSCKPDATYENDLVAIEACDPLPADGTVFTNAQYMNAGTVTGGALAADEMVGRVFSFDRSLEGLSEVEEKHTETTGSGKNKKTTTSYTYSASWVSSHQHFSQSGTSDPPSWPSDFIGSHSIADQICAGNKDNASCPAFTTESFVFLRSDETQSEWMYDIGVKQGMALRTGVTVSGLSSPYTSPALVCGGNYIQTQLGSCSSPKTADGRRPGGWVSTPGDFRWSWSRKVKTPTLVYSGIAEQIKNSDGRTTGFKEWQNPDYDDCSYCRIGDFYNEDMTGQEILDKLKAENTVLTWVLRFVGWLLVWFGCQLCFAPIAAAPTLIPVVGDFIGGVVGSILCCMTCMCGTAIAVMVMGIAWLIYRPLIGVPLLLVCCLGTVATAFLVMKQKKKRDALNKRYDAVDNGATNQTPYQQVGNDAPGTYPGGPPPGQYPTEDYSPQSQPYGGGSPQGQYPPPPQQGYGQYA
eukprot:TRINITY_DN1693_c0_g1_i2.p1 TRINITY_DN1693_c0_g1~~TRINITY_DN1693_c0_g1_i2.p1  ORF type:complete len:534 (+),score=120.11 TRINITY_DN1693_c0_g1_i2:110-1711(+)